MMIRIHQPAGYSEVGSRPHNEDAIYPAPGRAGAEDAFFMVCDGVGGANKGEVASALIVETFPVYIAGKGEQQADFYQTGLQRVEERLSAYMHEHPDCQGMASTLTFLHIRERDVVLGWAGDSRIYHIRDGRILFRTRDHSLVNKLVQMGEISEEEARSHPQRNVIMRAVKGGAEPTRLDVQVITDVQAGDFFLLCTDGVLETFRDEQAGQLFGAKQTPRQIADRMLEQAEGTTNDNYSAYLIKVAQGTGSGAAKSSKILTLFRWLIPVLFVVNLVLLFNWLRTNGYFDREKDKPQPAQPMLRPESQPSQERPSTPEQQEDMTPSGQEDPSGPQQRKSEGPTGKSQFPFLFPIDTSLTSGGFNILIKIGKSDPDSVWIREGGLQIDFENQN